MLTMIFKVNAPGWAAQGLKELIAMEIERKYGEVRCVEIREDDRPEQQTITGVTR